MPHRRTHRHGSDAHDHADAHVEPHAAPIRRRRPIALDYTLGHAGRQLRRGPVAFWTVVGTLVIMASWSVVTATYFAFRDDLLTRLIARQTDMQYAYEDRIADLRGQVDRLVSRQLLDQEQFEQKLDQVVRRQSVLESRAATMSTVVDPTPTGSIKPPGRAGVTGERPTGSIKPSPISDTVILVAPPDREARLESRALPGAGIRIALRAESGGIEGALAR